MCILLKNDLLLIFTGPAEETIFPEIVSLTTNFNVHFIRNQELTFSAAVLSKCNMFIGHDTGFAHISGALKVPSFLIFGSSSLTKVWTPPSKNTNMIYFEDLNNIDPKKVIEKIN